MSEQHPFYKMSELIDKFNTERNSMDIVQLQDLRENIALTLFLLSDSAAQAIANYDSKEYERRREYAEKENKYRNTLEEKSGKFYNVADSERLARMECKAIDDDTVIALRQKERVRILLNAVNQILNSISTRISQLSKHT